MTRLWDTRTKHAHPLVDAVWLCSSHHALGDAPTCLLFWADRLLEEAAVQILFFGFSTPPPDSARRSPLSPRPVTSLHPFWSATPRTWVTVSARIERTTGALREIQDFGCSQKQSKLNVAKPLLKVWTPVASEFTSKGTWGGGGVITGEYAKSKKVQNGNAKLPLNGSRAQVKEQQVVAFTHLSSKVWLQT